MQGLEYGLAGGRTMYRVAMHGGAGLIGTLFVLVAAAALVGLIVWLIVRKTGGHAGAVAAASANDPAVAIARDRLARGEIDPEQYAAIIAALVGQTPASGGPPAAP